MPKLRILVGLPASGKSTFAESKSEKYKVFSSDSYREIYKIEDNKELFEKLHSDIIDSLRNGNDCILDATNISRYKRMMLINRVNDVVNNVYICCDLFVVPIQDLIKRNENRPDNHGVTKEVILRMLSLIQIPWYSEGFNKIYVHSPEGESDLGYDRNELRNISSDENNPSLDVLELEKKAYKYIQNKYIFTEHYPFLLEAIKYHGDGKYYAKDIEIFNDAGIKKEKYFGFDKISAYLFLLRSFYLKQFSEQDKYHFTTWGLLFIANLISLQLRPEAWKKYPISKKEDRDIFGKDMINCIKIMNEAINYAKGES